MRQSHDPKLVSEAVHTIQMLAVDGVEKANSGHPGTPMALAAITCGRWILRRQKPDGGPASVISFVRFVSMVSVPRRRGLLLVCLLLPFVTSVYAQDQTVTGTGSAGFSPFTNWSAGSLGYQLTLHSHTWSDPANPLP